MVWFKGNSRKLGEIVSHVYVTVYHNSYRIVQITNTPKKFDMTTEL